MTKISIIAAVAENRVIGNKNKLPWRIKSDMMYFTEITRRKPLILGRKTFESIGNPLKDRFVIVVTRNAKYQHEGIIVASTFDNALDIARKIAKENNQEEIMIGGGTEIYTLALPLVDKLYLTKIHLKPEGDALFPSFDHNDWSETKRKFHKAKVGETADYTITVLERKTATSCCPRKLS
ncbi:MAG: dihydrofolate reductase [Alphaproteobacteria bacterium]|nr:dihydrofolate reductase [Alphaproteobacteria bacterium]